MKTNKFGHEIRLGDIVRPNPKHISCDCEVVESDKDGMALKGTNWTHEFGQHVWNECEILSPKL